MNLDDDLPGDAALLPASQIKSTCPKIRCLVLVCDEQQRQRVRETSADLMLIKGHPAAKLKVVVAGLLSRGEKGGAHEGIRC